MGKKTNYNPIEEKIDYLENRIANLREICTVINPYKEIPDNLKMRLLDLNILDFSDPFKLTNALLTLLEDTMDELHVVKPFHENEKEKKQDRL